MKASLLALAAAAMQAAAECPNACSGHGLCREHDQCKCDPNYMGNDCSQRVCPFDLSFVDTPRGDLNHDGRVLATSETNVQWSNAKEFEVWPIGAATKDGHFYSECSGKGDCDRDSGECKCFAGYTGSACQRAACPKDCSGHGICRTLREIAAGALNKRVEKSVAGHKHYVGIRAPFDYNLWDADKQQACVCDPGFSGSDCSLRQCPRGDDPLTTEARFCGGTACTWEIQKFVLSSAAATTYKIGFTDSLSNTLFTYVTLDVAGTAAGYVADMTNSIPGADTVAGKIMNALRDIPGGALRRVEVYPVGATGVDSRTFGVTFVGVPGNQDDLVVVPVAGSGDVVQVNSKDVNTFKDGNFEEIECSGRGLCDNGSGLCKCFTGYFGASCEFQNALSN